MSNTAFQEYIKSMSELNLRQGERAEPFQKPSTPDDYKKVFQEYIQSMSQITAAA